MTYTTRPLAQPDFLPMSREETTRLGWDALDVLLVSGDAYVDHPSFGPALLGRFLVAHGFRTGIVAQPDWRTPDDVARLGRPRLYAGVTAGALDSLLAHYTAFRKKRSDDAYTPGGAAGARPNRACLVYANLVRQAFPGLPVVLGGIEASLRRISHYDFWSDSLRRSILLDAKADLVVYGMGERATVESARRIEAALAEGREPREALKNIPGTVFAGRAADLPEGAEIIELPSHEAILAEPKKLVEATLALERQVHRARAYATQDAVGRLVVLAPPAAPLETSELDALYALPFSRRAHPSYAAHIPALTMIKDSVTSHRGCAGGCAFCALALHQGRRLRSRSRASILGEVRRMAGQPGFSGSVSDVGGPSANMWGGACTADPATCARSSCLTPKLCPHFNVDQMANVELLRAVREVPGVRHVRQASGLRFDLAMREPEALKAMIAEFVGGQIKVAPEHLDDAVLTLMRKPGRAAFEAFLEIFAAESRRAGKEQYVVPYLMSAHPGSSDAAMDRLAAWFKARGWRPRQVQCFIPLPGTLSAAMYYAGVDAKGRPIPVARTDAERLAQHARLTPRDGDLPPGRPRRKTPRKTP